jgi:crotonobetainyl-CoA:carnitine CoA-transferase CaiB-like acyl-CoA transferase
LNSRLLPTRDGWIAVTLARPSDVELLPAWIGTDLAGLEAAVRARTSGELVDQGVLLGLPVAALGEFTGPAVLCAGFGPHRGPNPAHGLRVLDLSSLWAGPLAAHLLANDGARVTKAESVQRPDALRDGRPDLYAELNDNKTIVTFDRHHTAALEALIADADVVIESSRRRALEQRGIVAADWLERDDGPHVWASITGYGRASNRVAFGDDAAVAGGLVRYDAGGNPRFKGDAVADPLTGIATYDAIRDALREKTASLLDVSMAGVAAAHASKSSHPHE